MEREYKFLVGRAVFQEALRAVRETEPPAQGRLQINYYYDDDRLSLRAQDVTLRVRQSVDGLSLQWKRHLRRQTHLVESEEREQPMDRLPLAVGAYALKGSLATMRERYPFPGYHIDFDTSYYLGVCDYEVEIELDDGACTAPPAAFAALAAQAQTGRGGKGSRFFARWEQAGRLSAQPWPGL